MSLNHILSNVPDEERIDVKFKNIVCNTITATGGGGSSNIITRLDPDYTGFNFVYDSVYQDNGSQLVEARRINENFYLSGLVEMTRLSTYTTTSAITYIWIPIPTSIKNILATEYPPMTNNNIRWDINMDIVADGPHPTPTTAKGGAVSIYSPGYELTHLRVEFKDPNFATGYTGPCRARYDIRFAPRVLS